MKSRRFFDYAIISLKGIAMGAADVVPGVSGGTIAFISGIYEELIETIHQLDLGFFKVLKKQGFKTAWKQYNLSFLVALFGGVLVSILSLAKLITFLLATYPLLVWGFFFGLVVASILYVGKQITQWNFKTVLALLIAVAISYFITIAEPIGTPDKIWFLFLAGSIAIIAMILPGVSGAFILLLLGAYSAIMNVLNGLREGVKQLSWELISEPLLRLSVFALGAIVGLKLFSKVLNWLFQHKKNSTLAVLTGFMIGALNKIWPWKEVLSFRTNSHGEEVPFLEKSILPSHFEGDPKVLWVMILAVVGFLTIFLLERLAVQKKKS
ncbi:MAG: DUF368 domain-containing protein [Flavobacteriaceae bacterium]|nr:DUF368 domain-containing protein [Flavobacteriaceae bacterium]|tara:strand:- start:67429 stop:68400 length:972 start_codon:yes stop_codon:yes gene_type:complete